MLFVTLILLLLATLVWYLKSCNNYFKKRNIPHVEPTMFFGNAFQMILGKENIFETIYKISKKFIHLKYVGFYKFMTPALIINDVDLIGQMLVKDFQHFADNDIVANEEDFIGAKNLFVLKGQEWRYKKSLLTPMFTTLKLKSVYPLMEEVGGRYVEFIRKEIKAGRADCIEGKPLCIKFTTENVASSVFGLQSQAFVSCEEEESEFVKVARDFGDPTYWNLIKTMLIFMVPSLNQILKVNIFSKSAEEYLVGSISQALKYRKENNIVRNDFLDMISSLKEKSTDYVFDDKDVVAQAAGFFLDGVETSASVLSYVIYELGVHPDIQEKLRREIFDVKDENKGQIPYDQFVKMEYLECVINETLRKNTPLMALFKTCTKDYKLPPAQESGQEYQLRKGDVVFIPAETIHQNPEFYPEPEKFNPDRFSNENKNNLVKHTFLPFGEGPRACLGMRFGMTQIKVAVIALLSNFQIEVNEKTENPLGISAGTIVRSPKNGFWFRFKEL